LFSLAVFWHFVSDWFFQSHTEALTKSRDDFVIAWHCLKYSVMFMIPVCWIGLGGSAMLCLLNLNILYWSHYFIDSYIPVMWWAKFLRKYPTFHGDSTTLDDKNLSDLEAFKLMAATPLGLILIITIDQLLHIAFLIPVVVLIALYAL